MRISCWSSDVCSSDLQRAELSLLLVSERLGLVGERLEFSVKIAGFAHRLSFLVRGSDEPAMPSLIAVQAAEISCDFVIPSAMKSCEGALIRRADVRFLL